MSMFIRLDIDMTSKQNIIAGTTGEARIRNVNNRRIQYFIETNYLKEAYKKVMGANEKVTAKTFIIACYEYYNERYN